MIPSTYKSLAGFLLVPVEVVVADDDLRIYSCPATQSIFRVSTDEDR